MSELNRRRMRYPRRAPSRQVQNELDRFLETRGMWRKHIAKDGSCLFRAVAEQVYLSQVEHLQVRKECVEYIRRHQADFKEFLAEPVDSYLFKLCHPTCWAGEIELVALANIYQRRIEVYHYQEDQMNQVGRKSFGNDSRKSKILLAYSDGNHYDSIMTKDFRNSSAICQSILYEILLKSVLKVPVPNRRDLQPYNRQKDYSGDLKWKDLSPDDLMAFSSKMYFNAALGIHKTYKEDLESQDWHLAMAMQFQEGDDCQVWIEIRKEKKIFDGVIKATNTSRGRHKIFIYELNKTMEVKHQDLNVLSLVGGRKTSARSADWLTLQSKRKISDKPSTGRGTKHTSERSSQGKSSAEKSQTTYLMSGHRKKRGKLPSSNTEGDEVDPELQEQLRLIELQDKETSFPALSSQAAKAVSEQAELPNLLNQPVTTISSMAVTSTPVVLTTAIAGSLPSRVMPRVKPLQQQQTMPTPTLVAATQSSVNSYQLQVTPDRHQHKANHLNNPQFTTTNDSSSSPLSSTEEFTSAKSVVATSVTNVVSSVTRKGNHLALRDGSVQQINAAKQLMETINQEKESQQLSERQLLTLSMTMSPLTSSSEQHSSWPELLSQDDHRATPSNIQEKQVIVPSTFSGPKVAAAYATQAIPTANTATHMPSTAVSIAKAPPSFFTATRAPPTVGQATAATKVAQINVTTVRTSVMMTASVVQTTPTNRTLVTGSQSTPTANRAPPTHYQNLSVPTTAIKTAGFNSVTLASPTSIATEVAPPPKVAVATSHMIGPTTSNSNMPLIQFPEPPWRLFQDGNNDCFLKEYGRMCFELLLHKRPDLAVMIPGGGAKLSHPHDIDYSEEEWRLIEEQSQRLESWKNSSSGVLCSMKDLHDPPPLEEPVTDFTNKSTAARGVEHVTSQASQEGTRKLQIMFPVLKEPMQQHQKSTGYESQDKDGYLKNLSKEEVEMLQSLVKKLDLHQLEAKKAAAGGVNNDETISAHTNSSLPPTDTEGTPSMTSEPPGQLTSPIQTAPEQRISASQSAESLATSPDEEPLLQPSAVELPAQLNMTGSENDVNAEKPGDNMDHQQGNVDGEIAGYPPGMIPHNPMAAMATMGPFMPPTAAAGFMPTMLPTPISPYMVPLQMYYHHQMLQQAHYNHMIQQSMAAAAAGVTSPTILPNSHEDGNFLYQQKNMEAAMMNTSPQVLHNDAEVNVDPVETTANANHPDDEQLRGSSQLQGGYPPLRILSENLPHNQEVQSVSMTPSAFTSSVPAVSSPAHSLPSSNEDITSNSQLLVATEEQHQVAKDPKLLTVPPEASVLYKSTDSVTSMKLSNNTSSRREPSKNHTSTTIASNGRNHSNTHSWKRPQSNSSRQDNKRNTSVQQTMHYHNIYDVDTINQELSQMGMHNDFPDGIPSMVFSSDKRRKNQT